MPITTGWTISRGKHLIKALLKTQAILVKSSAESELYAVVNKSCEGLGVEMLLKDVGDHSHVYCSLGCERNYRAALTQQPSAHLIRHLVVAGTRSAEIATYRECTWH